MKASWIALVIVASITLAGCSSEYIMSTKDGRMITTYSKPKLDKKTGMYNYQDEEGRTGQIKESEITQIIER